jgi:uncharacterized tellurite resistance protein B-like protein
LEGVDGALSQTERDRLRRIVEEAWRTGFTVMSDIAQAHMAEVAMAASLNLITTRIDKDQFGRVWRITTKGLRWLNEEKV